MENGICTCKRYNSELEWQNEYAEPAGGAIKVGMEDKICRATKEK